MKVRDAEVLQNEEAALQKNKATRFGAFLLSSKYVAQTFDFQ